MTNERILLIHPNPEIAQILERAVFTSIGYQVSFVSDWNSLRNVLLGNPPDLIISATSLNGTSGLELLWVPGGIDILAQADLAKQTGVICLVPHLPHPGRDIDPYR